MAKDISKRQARGTLEQLAKAMASDGPNAQAVWDIVTALRGPDISTNHRMSVEELKERSTVYVRGALLEEFGHEPFGSARFLTAPPTGILNCSYAKEGGSHFCEHVQAAIAAMRVLDFGRLP